MAPKKGHTNNPNGRTKGVPNKTTAEARALFITVMNGEIENIREALEKIRQESPAKYVDALAKLFQYTIPKQVDIKTDGEKITDVKVTYVDRIDEGNNSQPGT
jgi:ribosome recycling factor